MPNFPTDGLELKRLERTFQGRTTRPVDPNKLRVRRPMSAKPRPELRVDTPSGASTGKALMGVVRNAPRAAVEIATVLPPAIAQYARTHSPSDVASDIRGGLSSYADYFRENPAEATVDMIPFVGDAKAVGQMIREAAMARDAGDEELAAQIESYVLPVAALGFLPEAGGLAAAGARKMTRRVPKKKGGLAVKRKDCQ